MQQLSWCGTNTYPHILMPAALQKIDIDPEQLLYTPKIVDNAACAAMIIMAMIIMLKPRLCKLKLKKLVRLFKLKIKKLARLFKLNIKS
ncbi:hypothetical protein LAZ67_18000720 [Cordylochernes scorpioides]|uniref:Uncharacterized protein n=1 Tax=Cordylochernes scorpioides TaxID=51811 RepID=A0ABY6LF97_9ARAC|nr:hypothetical protein LAZ67_18000720 [Cordylochernes scorpioides]